MELTKQQKLLQQSLEGFEINIAEFLVEKLVSSLGDKAADAATGWILNAIGIDTHDDSEKLKKIQEALDEQKKMLVSIESEVAKVEQQIKDAVTEIEDKIDQSLYVTTVNVINLEVSEIQGLMERLKDQSAKSPDPAHRSDAELLRNDILSKAITAVLAIKNCVMGAAGAEGLFSLWARLSFKHSNSLTDYASKLYQQFMYYYTIQVNALQLIVEAYHCGQTPDTKAAVQYYTDWKAWMDVQISEYKKNAIRTSVNNVVTVNGAVLDFAVTNDHIYVLTNSNLYSYKTSDWSLDGSIPVSFNELCNICITGNYLLVAGSQSMKSINILKVNIKDGFVLEGQTVLQSQGKGSWVLFMLSGLAADANNLYLLTIDLGITGYQIHVMDIASLAFVPEKQFACTDGIQEMGDLAVINGVAFMPGYYNGFGHTLTSVDLINKRIMARLPLTLTEHGADIGGSPICISDNLAVFSQSNKNVWFVNVKDPSNLKILQTADYGMYLKSLDADGNLIYFSSGEKYNNPGGLNCIYRSDYQQGISKSWDLGSTITKVSHIGDYLLVSSHKSANPGKITVLGYAYPVETPPQPTV
jgi:hypothetical protein